MVPYHNPKYVLCVGGWILLGSMCDAAPKFWSESATEDKFCLSGASTGTSIKLEHAPCTMAKLKLEYTTSVLAIITHSVGIVAHILVVTSWLIDWLEA